MPIRLAMQCILCNSTLIFLHSGRMPPSRQKATIPDSKPQRPHFPVSLISLSSQAPLSSHLKTPTPLAKRVANRNTTQHLPSPPRPAAPPAAPPSPLLRLAWSQLIAHLPPLRSLSRLCEPSPILIVEDGNPQYPPFDLWGITHSSTMRRPLRLQVY